MLLALMRVVKPLWSNEEYVFIIGNFFEHGYVL